MRISDWISDVCSSVLLSLHVAAVEILNVIRPIVAVGVYITFVAHALHQFPECRRKVEAGDDTSYTEMFVQEVRRFYPFFPAVAALVRREFERSEERRGGNECASTCRSRGSPSH